MYNALFIGWGTPVRGRETQAAKVFGEWVELLGTHQSKGTVKSFQPVFIQARGGDLQGFFLIQGDTNKLQEFMNTEEVRRATTRAQLIVDNFGVCLALTGDEIGKQMQLFQSNATELSK
jgi:hypothetical protein